MAWNYGCNIDACSEFSLDTQILKYKLFYIYIKVLVGMQSNLCHLSAFYDYYLFVCFKYCTSFYFVASFLIRCN